MGRRIPIHIQTLTTILVVAALVLAAAPAGASRPVGRAPGEPARTLATTIHILGSFNGWDQSLWVSDPGMTHVGAVWTDTVSIFPWDVQQNYQEFKLVTDRAWDVPADYCLCPDRLDEYTLLSGPVCLVSYAPNLQMYADVAGRYEMTLDEDLLTYSARLIEPFTARITGIVKAAGSLAPLQATVRLYGPGGTLVLASASSAAGTGAFAAGNLDGGTYDLRVSAPGYVDATVSGVAVAAGGSVDVGTITLTSGCTSSFFAIQLVGDFNGWDVNVPSMTQVQSCVWQTTVHVTAGCSFLKFRTNNDWGNDYGTCTAEDLTCQVPMAGSVCLVSGGLALGKINFPVTADYTFQLDEINHHYEIQQGSVPARRVTWGQLKIRYR